jgi:phosphoribosyl-AMP cyclohydrolase
MTEANLMEKLDWKKMNGLIPVVVQDAKSKEVLMLAYANKEALEHTLKTGKGTYWSRSRKELWVKGETSGHTQRIVRVVADCDYDAVLYVVEQKGPVCHTGADTCFHHEFQR